MRGLPRLVLDPPSPRFRAVSGTRSPVSVSVRSPATVLPSRLLPAPRTSGISLVVSPVVSGVAMHLWGPSARSAGVPRLRWRPSGEARRSRSDAPWAVSFRSDEPLPPPIRCDSVRGIRSKEAPMANRKPSRPTRPAKRTARKAAPARPAARRTASAPARRAREGPGARVQADPSDRRPAPQPLARSGQAPERPADAAPARLRAQPDRRTTSRRACSSTRRSSASSRASA